MYVSVTHNQPYLNLASNSVSLRWIQTGVSQLFSISTAFGNTFCHNVIIISLLLVITSPSDHSFVSQVPAESTGLLIGAKGATINGIKQQFGVEITVPKKVRILPCTPLQKRCFTKICQ